jgi:hypothetical protein
LPGVLTAVATLITAVTGLIIGLNQIGLFDHPHVSVDTAAVRTSRDGQRSQRPPVEEAGGGSGEGTADTLNRSPDDMLRSEGVGTLTTTSGTVEFDRISSMSMGRGKLTVQQLGSRVDIPLSSIKRIDFMDGTTITIHYGNGETEQAQFDCYWNLPVTFHTGGRELYYGDCGDFAVVTQIEFHRPVR